MKIRHRTYDPEYLVSLMDLATQRMITTLPVGESPTAVAVNPNTQQAIIANEKDDSLTLIDLVSATVLGHISVGRNPKGVAIHPDTNLVVVANKKEDTVSLIDLFTAILTRPAPVGKDPRGVGIETDADLAVVVNKKNDTLSLLNLPDGSLIATLPVGEDPEGVAVDSLSNKALVTNKEDNTVTIIDLVTQTVAATLLVGKDPHGVAIHLDTGLAVVTNKKDDTLSLIDLDTLTVQGTIPAGRDPLDVAIDLLTHQAWIIQEKDDSVTIVDLTTETPIAILSVGEKPQRIAIDSETNQAVVTNKKDNTISIIDLTTRGVVATLLVGKDPIGVAIHPRALEAYVVNHHDNTVSIIDLSDKRVTETIPVGKHPREIAIHPRLNLAVVTNEGDDTVSILQLAGLPPSITAFSPTQGGPGTLVTLTGEDFDETPANNAVFFFNKVAATVSAATTTSLTVTVPAGAATGPMTVTTPIGSATSTQNFIVANPVPALTSLNPSEVPAGSGDLILTLTGTNFIPGSTVRFGLKGVATTFISGTQLTALIPAALLATPGTASVSVSNPAPGGGTSNFLTFTTIGPVITGFSPTSGKIGTPVTITGQNFDPTPSNNVLSFNGTSAVITSATTAEIKTTVPQGATTGPITVTTPTGTATGATPFTVPLSQDFSLNLLPATANMVAGSHRFISIGATGINGFTDWISLTTDPLPAGISMLFLPPQVPPEGRASVEILAEATTVPGIFPILFRGTAQIDGQTIIRTAAFSLQVLAGGNTTLSGQVLSTDNTPIPGATVSLGTNITTTDAAGRFFLDNVPAGQQVIIVDGRTAIAPSTFYPEVEAVTDILAGVGNVLPFIIYLPEIDTAHPIDLPVDATGTTTVAVQATTPLIPGLEVNIPVGTQIIDPDGNPVSRITITPVPPDRAPMPLPDGVDAPLLFTIQPGGATLSQPVPITFPNLDNAPPGERADFFFFDVVIQDWVVYGQGTVSPDGRQIVPDPGVGLPRFAWHFPRRSILVQAPDPNPTPDGPPVEEGDPVDMATGLFTLSKTDMVIPGRIPIVLTRHYHSGKTLVGPFGIGTGHRLDPRLVFVGDGEGQLVLTRGDDSRMPFSRNADGTYTNSTNPSMAGARITLFNSQRILRFKDGTRWIFSTNGRLVRQEDRNGNALTF